MYYRNPSWIKNGTSAHAPLPWQARIRSVSFSSHWVSLPPRKRRRFLLHKETQLPLATWKFQMLRLRLWWLPPRVTCTMDTLIQLALMNVASTHFLFPFPTALSTSYTTWYASVKLCTHTTILVVVDVVVYFLWLYFWGIRWIDDNDTPSTLTFPNYYDTRCSSSSSSSCHGCSLHWFYFCL